MAEKKTKAKNQATGGRQKGGGKASLDAMRTEDGEKHGERRAETAIRGRKGES